MKKIKGLAILFVTLFIVTGCGGSTQTLTCTMEKSENGIKMNQNISVNFKDKLATTGKLVMDIELSKEVLPYKSMMVNLLETSFKESFNLKESEGINFSNKDTAKGLEVTVNFDFKKIIAANKENKLLGKSSDYKSAKESLEEQGYSCK